ncbi:S1 RNA-binding domain-containing protein [Streptomyces sp. ID05-04B]|uniref:S1 RNA-binding domain-containing protein n=1 Tax=Streptomyces sp. ID05-04B TaxID=3028661 RepID=UPI0029C9F99F|nr:S1 RNA-binding domain-containing protein [Streptomyces sp. ID05-04B]
MMGGPSENPELWAFLKSLHCGEILSGFITIPELSWPRIEAAFDVVQVGQRVSAEFLQFDTWNLEARLSLRATQPDPFQAFADRTAVGQKLHGQVTKLVPFGVFVQVTDGIEGLVPRASSDLRPRSALPNRVPRTPRGLLAGLSALLAAVALSDLFAVYAGVRTYTLSTSKPCGVSERPVIPKPGSRLLGLLHRRERTRAVPGRRPAPAVSPGGSGC